MSTITYPLRSIAISTLVLTLCFVWFTYHTTAIRYSAAFIALVLLTYFNLKVKNNLNCLGSLKAILTTLAILTVWLLIHTYFFAIKPVESFDAVQGEWLKALLFGWLALALILYYKDKNSSSFILSIVVYGFTLTIIVYYIDLGIALLRGDIGSAWGMVRYPVNFQWSEAGRESLSTMITMVLCFLLGEFSYRQTYFKSYLPFSNLHLYSLISVFILTLVLLKTRLSQVDLIILLILILTFIYRKKVISLKKRTKYILFIVSLLIIPLSYGLFKMDSRWNTILDSVDYVSNESNSQLWLRENFERATPEQQAFVWNNHSNYLRIISIIEGIKTIATLPNGVGYGKQAFKKAVQITQHATPLLGNSHNGVIEFTVGVGLVGLALLGCWIIALLWFAYRHIDHPAALMLGLLTIIYFWHNLFDQRLMDHYLEVFIFSSFLLAGAVSVDKVRI
jgi:hypothetical protein